MTAVVSPRPLCEGLPDMWRTEVKEAKNNHQEKHTQPVVQRGHHLRHSPGERGTSQSVHHGDGLRSVSEAVSKNWTCIRAELQHKSLIFQKVCNWNNHLLAQFSLDFYVSSWTALLCASECVLTRVSRPTGWDTMRWSACVTPGRTLRVLDEITGTKCWLTHGSPSHTGTPWERYSLMFTELCRSSWMSHWPQPCSIEAFH